MNDPTFTNYSADLANDYSQYRRGYPLGLIQYIVDHHRKTGGQSGCVADVGCGPGTATRDLAEHFEHAIGVDPSAEMIKVAQALGGAAQQGRAIGYRTGAAEACDGIGDGSVDLLTAAMSAHWFDMERFWPTAARVLQPGGTVALFNVYRMFCHPATPNAAEVQRLLDELEHDTLRPFTLPGNFMVIQAYQGLGLPWTISSRCDAFPQAVAIRKVWNEGGRADADGSYFSGESVETLDQAEKSIGTSSAVTRWRAAHPELAFTARDCVASTFARIRTAMGPHANTITMVGPVVLLLLKRL